jgi:hypothetical protein
VRSISPIARSRRRAVAALVVACATAPFALIGVANAEPDPNAPAIDPKAQCETPEVGGVFVTDVKDGVSRSVCQYIVSGHFYYDTFENGTYVGTSVYQDGATRPTERPVMPDVLGPGTLSINPFF